MILPRRRAALAALWALLASGAIALRAGDNSPVAGTAPARALNWRLPVFTKEGFLSMTLAGSEVRPVGSDRIDLQEMNITVFSGDASERIDTILLSPSATYFSKEQRASGSDGVRMIRDDCEITGDVWSYEQIGKKVSIHGHVHVVYRAPLKGIAP